jgi:carbon monoxide dehydrogenase subunit G
MQLTSQEAQINTSAADVFTFLSDCQNIIHLLPEDKISDWKATTDECSFKVQKMATIPLVVKERVANSEIKMVSGEGAPFPFTLDIVIESVDDNSCKGHLVFNGEVNAFLKMMIEKPMSSLFDYMSHKLQKRFEN